SDEPNRRATGRVKVGAGISAEHDPLAAGVSAARLAADRLAGESADLALVFASGAHLAAPEATLEGVTSVLEPATVVGCGAGGVVGGGRELETGTAVAVWAGSFDGAGSASAFHATLIEESGEHAIEGLPELDGSSGVLMLSDPYSFPTDAALALMSDA